MTLVGRRRAVLAADAFTPKKIANLRAWYNDDDLTGADGTGVSQWNDSSGNGYHLTQPTSGKRPTLATRNGKRILRFTKSASQSLFGATASDWTFLHNGSGMTIVFVAKIVGPDVDQTGCFLSTSSPGTTTTGVTCRYDNRAAQSMDDQMRFTIMRGVNGAPALSVDTIGRSFRGESWQVVGLRHKNDGTASDALLSIGGHRGMVNTAGTGAFSTAAAPASGSPLMALRLGAYTTSDTDPLDGYIAEVVIYNRKLTDAEVGKVRRYLARRHGVPVLELTLDNTTLENDSNYNAFPGSAICANGDWYSTYRKGPEHDETIGKVYAKRSTDRGATFGSEFIIADDSAAGFDARSGDLTRLANGDLILCYIRDDPAIPRDFTRIGDIQRVKRSTDNGATWGTAYTVTSGFARFSQTTAPVVELPNGDMLVALQGWDSSSDTRQSIRVSKSTDGGVTWADFGLILSGPAVSKSVGEPNIVRCADGSLYCMIRNDTDESMWSCRSTDSGATWSTPAAQSPFTAHSGAPRILLTRGGLLVVVLRLMGVSLFAGMYVSDDHGATWQTSNRVQQTGRMVYSQMAQHSDLIHVTHGIEVNSTNSDIYHRTYRESGVLAS